MTSVFKDNGLITPCNFKNSPHALHREFPLASFLHNGVVPVPQLEHLIELLLALEGILLFMVEREVFEGLPFNIEGLLFCMLEGRLFLFGSFTLMAMGKLIGVKCWEVIRAFKDVEEGDGVIFVLVTYCDLDLGILMGDGAYISILLSSIEVLKESIKFELEVLCIAYVEIECDLSVEKLVSKKLDSYEFINEDVGLIKVVACDDTSSIMVGSVSRLKLEISLSCAGE